MTDGRRRTRADPAAMVDVAGVGAAAQQPQRRPGGEGKRDYKRQKAPSPRSLPPPKAATVREAVKCEHIAVCARAGASAVKDERALQCVVPAQIEIMAKGGVF